MYSTKEPHSGRSGRGQPLRALVVDGDRDAGETLTVLLGLWGHDARLATDLGEALKADRTDRPDVVFLDPRLLRSDAGGVAHRFRERAWVVGLTEEDAEASPFAPGAGFDEWLSKPFDPGALELLLTRLGGLAGESRETCPHGERSAAA